MKTTVELPTNLLHRAKFIAAQRRTTLKKLIIQGLEHVTLDPADHDSQPLKPEEEVFLKIDTHGVPVLKETERSLQPVTNQSIDDLREELGI